MTNPNEPSLWIQGQHFDDAFTFMVSANAAMETEMNKLNEAFAKLKEIEGKTKPQLVKLEKTFHAAFQSARVYLENLNTTTTAAFQNYQNADTQSSSAAESVTSKTAHAQRRRYRQCVESNFIARFWAEPPVWADIIRVT